MPPRPRISLFLHLHPPGCWVFFFLTRHGSALLRPVVSFDPPYYGQVSGKLTRLDGPSMRPLLGLPCGTTVSGRPWRLTALRINCVFELRSEPIGHLFQNKIQAPAISDLS